MVEVLTVLGVVAVLTTVAVTGSEAVLERARISRTASDVRVVVNALRQYQIDVGLFPAAVEDLTTQPADAPRWKGPYLDRWPAGAAWDRAAVQRLSTSGGSNQAKAAETAAGAASPRGPPRPAT